MNSASTNASNKRKRKPRKREPASKPQKRKTRKPAAAADEYYLLRDIPEEKLQDGKIHYLIDWEGTDKNGNPHEPSWEPAENVTDAAINDWREKKSKEAAGGTDAVAQDTGSPTQTSTQDTDPVLAPNWRRRKRSAKHRPLASYLKSSGHGEEGAGKRRRTVDGSGPYAVTGQTGQQLSEPRDRISGQATGARFIVELPLLTQFDPSEFHVISPLRFSQQSSQSPQPRKPKDRRIVPDSQEISGTSASEAHHSNPDAVEDTFSAAHRARLPRELGSSAHASSEIPSHQLDVRPWFAGRRRASATDPSQFEESSGSGGQNENLQFLTQVPFDLDVVAPTSQAASPSVSTQDTVPASLQPRSDVQHSQRSYASQSSLLVNSGSTRDSSNSQAAQIVQHLSSQSHEHHELASQSQSDFAVYDEDDVVPNTASRQAPTQTDSQDSSQALSELDGNTRVSLSALNAHEIESQAALLASQSLVSSNRYSNTTGSEILSDEGSRAPSGYHAHSPSSPQQRKTKRLSVITEPPVTPTRMDGSPAPSAPLSARERLKRIRENAFSKSIFDETPASASPTTQQDAPSGNKQGNITILQARVHTEVAQAAEPSPAPVPALVSPTFVVPSLETGQHEPRMSLQPLAGDVPPAPTGSLPPDELSLGVTGTSQVTYTATHEEQPSTLDPSALTLSIEGAMDVSPSIPTNDGLATSIPIPEALAMDDGGELSPAYPKSLLPYAPTGLNEYLITLPFHNSSRPQYNDVLRKDEDLIREYSTSFQVSPYKTPHATTIAKLDEMFSRLFDMCDFPPFLDTVSAMAPDHIRKHVIDTNPKFSFVAELLDTLSSMGSEKKILILVRPGRLMDLLGNVVQTRGYHYVRAGQEVVGVSPPRHALTVAISSTADEPNLIPTDVDAVVAFDHTFRQELVSSRNEASPPIIMALAIEASIQHLNMRISENLQPLERKNVLVMALVNAMRYVEDPDHAVKLWSIADNFARHIQIPDDDEFYWEPPPLHEDIFQDFHAASSQTQLSQLSMPGSGIEKLPGSRKRSHVDDDEEILSKRPKMVQPQVVTDVSYISDSLKSLLGDDFTQDSEIASITVSVDKMEALSTKIANLQAEMAESKLRERQFRQLSDRSKTEVDSYASSINMIQTKFMAALKDRGIFEAECTSAKEEAKALTASLQSSRTENGKLEEKHAEVQRKLSEATELLLNSSNPEHVRMMQLQKDLDEATTKVEQLEKKVATTQKDAEYARHLYQQSSQRATELSMENRDCERQIEELQRKADENIVTINKAQAANDVKELTRMLGEQKMIVREREAELSRVKEDLKSARNGRRGTRQSSVPGSPRLNALYGVMSPRNAGGTRGASSRGTSPAPAMGGFDGSGGSSTPSTPVFNQSAGINRFAHLRDSRF
ncbi:Uu.00g086360.m01.CDS01 [Anthostomella pinea]|uniref:Uu.00g086360.m01.CDS01 n=1 Tax=Anthostomella pinea TaxID=933095 RepID=A0AAI8VNA4_9PEZI|nr:Uu.00g086360.m01.CDS01 [Anthostomella pinea]